MGQRATCQRQSRCGRSTSPWSAYRDLARVARQPRVERLQRRVERARRLDAARARERVVEVALELEHVAEVIGPGEPEAPEDLGRDVVVGDVLAERAAHPLGHL